MNIAAYCRVSTDKEDQLNSLEAQKEFFSEYTKRTGDNLVRLYADEGISGTKIKNRKEFLRMMADAEHGLFDMVVVKDISRFARNTVDLLQNVRKLKALGIETQFLTANMTSMGNSEFVLTIFGALAQEESANTSKRVKFGKKMNAEKGRVPNIVYGYDKTIGDYFNLAINEEEAAVVRQIYQWYIKDGYGAAKISIFLNERGLRTKRNCQWSQNGVCRILTNELYTGKIINGKQEVTDFLTGQRADKDASEWMVVDRPDLRIIDPETFEQAQQIMKSRGKAFKVDKERQSNKYLFSTLIKCKECGWSFRRTVRTYKNTYVRWVCSGHNGRGADNCPNAVTVDEDELIAVLEEYFAGVLKVKKNIIRYVVGEFNRTYKAKSENAAYGKEGMPAMNTTSYPKLIKAMREALGNDKLVTLTDYEAPTEYFWDTGATGGIEVGQYLDYAWSGYLDNEKNVQIVDPWHQGQQYVSTDHPRKPIAGLDPAKYGCINIPWYPQGPNTINDYFTDIFFWRQAGNKQSNILVFESLRTLLQDNFESTWASSIQVGYTYFADDGAWMIEDTPWGPSIMSDNEYSFDTSLLGKLPNGGTGYNKWLKDW